MVNHPGIQGRRVEGSVRVTTKEVAFSDEKDAKVFISSV